jgi:hypothetical protein
VRGEALAVAEAVLGLSLGPPVRLRVVREVRVGRVARCAMEGTDSASVVVKVGDTTDSAHRGLLHNEQAAPMLLGRVAPRLAPRLLGAKVTAGVLVEDLGDGPSLASYLLGDDPIAVREASVSSAAALGALHAATLGHGEENRRAGRQYRCLPLRARRCLGSWWPH